MLSRYQASLLEFYHDGLYRPITPDNLRRLQNLLYPAPISPFAMPLLTIIVVIYKMPRQALNTLRSLSADYQRDSHSEEYEVIVVENQSDEMLGKQRAESCGTNIRYFDYAESLPTPVNALNFAAGKAHGESLALMIDGARMLSPGVVKLALQCIRQDSQAVAVVPGYHLGREIQQEAVHDGYDEAAELQLMQSIEWPTDGYRLFDISCLSGSCRRGFFAPMSESNFLLLPASLYNTLGGFDTRFNSHGGGFANLDLYQRACTQSAGERFNFFAEGTFHQFHGGVTTGGVDDEQRQQIMQELRKQYKSIRQVDFAPIPIEYSYIGNINQPVIRFLKHSIAAL